MTAKETEARPFQKKVAALLLEGKNVILQAPTGSGKTRAALTPYIEARFWRKPQDFPRKCIYAVPMRVLANQFFAEYYDLFDSYSARHEGEKVPPFQTKVQSGERPEDRMFEGDLIFTTIDQVLSNFLAIPYALSKAKANVNPASVFNRYLILDEFHLFPAEDDGSGAFGTTLEMLKWLKNITPFVLMTATFSSEMINTLAKMLDAVPVFLSDKELEELPSQNKSRFYHQIDTSLKENVQDILAKHTNRSLVICNTVQRAQEIYIALRDNQASKGVTIKLLHSRFNKEDRAAKEEWARKEFGEEKDKYGEASAILVATQVIEVGLNITCENLHTELAPANSIVQRAGRCARYERVVTQAKLTISLPAIKTRFGCWNGSNSWERRKPLCQWL